MTNPWPSCGKLPGSAAAVLAALHLREPASAALGCLSDHQWRRALSFCDHSRLTLCLRDAARELMPQWARERADKDAAKNLIRLRGIEDTHRTTAGRLGSAGLDFIALKGLTHCALFGLRPDTRVQYDIDLFLPPETIGAARDALIACGYENLAGMEEYPTDHLPALIQKTGWEWRGDFFDPEIPLSLELHFRFWNERIERLPAPGTGEFWSRRVVRRAGSLELPVLSPPDALGYAALHALRHVLRGSAQPFQIYEIACVLESHAGRDAFWEEWRGLHPAGLRRLEVLVFLLAEAWFGCRMPAAAGEDLAQLPGAAKAWFDEFALSPAASRFNANKDELWLHLSLLESRRDRWGILRRRLLPAQIPSFGQTAYIPEKEITLRHCLRKWRRWAAYAASRMAHHARSLPQTAASGARWWWRTNGLF